MSFRALVEKSLAIDTARNIPAPAKCPRWLTARRSPSLAFPFREIPTVVSLPRNDGLYTRVRRLIRIIIIKPSEHPYRLVIASEARQSRGNEMPPTHPRQPNARGGSPPSGERNENGRTRTKYFYRGGFLHCVRTVVLTSVEMTLKTHRFKAFPLGARCGGTKCRKNSPQVTVFSQSGPTVLRTGRWIAGAKAQARRMRGRVMTDET